MEAHFPRSSRLTKKAEFTGVFAFRCMVRSTHFSVFAKSNAGINSRLGMTVARRVLPHAVDRNYAKRVIREVFRRHRHDYTGLDVVVSLRVGVNPGNYAAITAELLATIGKAQSRCPASFNG